MNQDKARELNTEVLESDQIIREYIARLYETYPDIPKMKYFKALENKAKRDLEDNCEEV